MKNLHIVIAFALLASAAFAQSAGGLSNITIFGNQDPTSCQLTLTLAVQPDQIVFTETVSDPNKDCSLKNLQFANAFRGDQVYGNITLAPTDDKTILTGALKLDDLQKFNGTACGVLLDNGEGDLLAACRFRYGDIFFHLAILLDKASLKFDAKVADLIFPNFGTTIINSTNGINLLTPNNTFPQIVGLISQQVDSTSPIINDINKNIWVTGTELASNVIDLNAILGDFKLVVMIIKPKDLPDDQFFVFTPDTEVIPFADKGTKGTIDTGIKFNEVVDDFDTCGGNGCEASFILQKDYNFFILQTNGFTTVQKARNLGVKALLAKTVEKPAIRKAAERKLSMIAP